MTVDRKEELKEVIKKCNRYEVRLLKPLYINMQVVGIYQTLKEAQAHATNMHTYTNTRVVVYDTIEHERIV